MSEVAREGNESRQGEQTAIDRGKDPLDRLIVVAEPARDALEALVRPDPSSLEYLP